MDATLKAIAEPHRRLILRLVWDTEKAAGEIAAELQDVSWPAVSQHLRVLKDCGLLGERRQGRRRLYAVRRDAAQPLRALLEATWREDLNRLKRMVEAEDPAAS